MGYLFAYARDASLSSMAAVQAAFSEGDKTVNYVDLNGQNIFYEPLSRRILENVTFKKGENEG